MHYSLPRDDQRGADRQKDQVSSDSADEPFLGWTERTPVGAARTPDSHTPELPHEPAHRRKRGPAQISAIWRGKVRQTLRRPLRVRTAIPDILKKCSNQYDSSQRYVEFFDTRVSHKRWAV